MFQVSQKEKGKDRKRCKALCCCFRNKTCLWALIILLTLLILFNLGWLDWQIIFKEKHSMIYRTMDSPSDSNAKSGMVLNQSEVALRTFCDTLLILQKPLAFFSGNCNKHPCCQDLGIMTPSIVGACTLGQIYFTNPSSNFSSLNWMNAWDVCLWGGVVCSSTKDIQELRIKNIGALEGGLTDVYPSISVLRNLKLVEFIGNGSATFDGMITEKIFELPELEYLLIGNGGWKMSQSQSLGSKLKTLNVSGMNVKEWIQSPISFTSLNTL